ncbi:hypothetical protein ACFRFJ_19410 [Streptomyces hydrogenans]|uniref:hypothetical protein n=1 Tax=Streptomyces hydrogenans TaxID=1873719 RepID=UPI0036A8EAF7
MTDTFAPSSRAARIHRLLTLLLITAALVAAVAAANTTAFGGTWWPKTGSAFTTPTAPGAPATETVPPRPAACGAGLDRTSCTHPATPGPGANGAPVLAAPVTPSMWTTALLLLPVAAGLTVVGRTRTRTPARDRKAVR